MWRVVIGFLRGGLAEERRDVADDSSRIIVNNQEVVGVDRRRER
jgi:hypothetical protein